MRTLFKPIFFLLVFLSVVGASLIVSSEVVSEEQDPLGNLNLPEGVDLVQLPENVITGATLPETLDKPTATEATTTTDVIASEPDAASGERGNLVPPQLNEIASSGSLPRNDDGGNKKIVIHLKTQTMDMVENGTVLNSFKISSGKRGMQTPTGSFKILSKVNKAYSRTYGLYMPYWMAFTTRGHGIHELPEWPNGYKEGENHLGTPVSHGCVRLGVGPAKAMYEWSEIGTPIEIVQQ